MDNSAQKPTEENSLSDKSNKPEAKKEGVLIAAFKFLPLLVFALAVIVFKLDLLIAAPIATFAAAGVLHQLSYTYIVDKSSDTKYLPTLYKVFIFNPFVLVVRVYCQ